MDPVDKSIVGTGKALEAIAEARETHPTGLWRVTLPVTDTVEAILDLEKTLEAWVKKSARKGPKVQVIIGIAPAELLVPNTQEAQGDQ